MALGVDLNCLIGQGNDGAAAMSGQFKGCAANIAKSLLQHFISIIPVTPSTLINRFFQAISQTRRGFEAACLQTQWKLKNNMPFKVLCSDSVAASESFLLSCALKSSQFFISVVIPMGCVHIFSQRSVTLHRHSSMPNNFKKRYSKCETTLQIHSEHYSEAQVIAEVMGMTIDVPYVVERQTKRPTYKQMIHRAEFLTS
ncbi:hypothetical protein PR048_001534 [Dryococelus australis]|uniref:Uncharacterized protein n=1 Tax=Dryococelus australis TaxID=614101 RepID=A0ABQ9IHR9_9NEOP|nr:hypothetical protein PR048_001534 [Dryococelus australis]